MLWPRLQLIALTGLFLAACGTGGREYWLYPEPHRGGPEEATFIVHEEHQVLSIDDEETAVRCWGEMRRPQAYRQKTAPCRLHILPGEHSVVFHPGANSLDRVRLDFTALEGRSYGLEWSACRGSVDQRHQRTCVVKVVEVEGPPE